MLHPHRHSQHPRVTDAATHALPWRKRAQAPGLRMKRAALIAACAATALGTCASAHAQSGVTIYGILDAGVTYFSNQGGKSNWSQSNGVDFPTTIGMVGREDLGGGLAAIFRLETAFKMNNGMSVEASQMFNKQALVGLQDRTLGTLQIGRLREFNVEMAQYVAAHGGIFGFHPGNWDQIVQSYLNNGVMYETPVWGGAQFGAMYAFGSKTTPVTNSGRAYGFKAAYANGPLQAMVTMQNINGTTINPGAIGLPYAFGQSTASSIASGIALQNLTSVVSDVSYRLGDLDLIGIYAYTRMQAHEAVEKLGTGEVGAVYHLSPAWSVGGAYSYSVGVGGRWHIFNLSTHYMLSKRTTLYLDGEFQRVTGAGQKAALLFSQASSTASQTAVTVGIKHAF